MPALDMTVAEIAVPDPNRAQRVATSPHPAPEQWEPWVRRARDGDVDAYRELIELFGPRILNYLRRMTSHHHDAEDLAQDTFVKMFRMLPQFTTPRAFPAWLFTIARRTALNHFRDRRCAEPLPPDLPSTAPDPGVTLDAIDGGRRLWELARLHLQPDQFEVLWLRYAEHLSLREISNVTRRTGIHVRVLLHRARRALLPVASRHGLHPTAP